MLDRLNGLELHEIYNRTDGRLWGPSRILGHFLVYRELDVKIPKPRNQKYDKQDRRIIDLDGKSATVGSKVCADMLLGMFAVLSCLNVGCVDSILYLGDIYCSRKWTN